MICKLFAICALAGAAAVVFPSDQAWAQSDDAVPAVECCLTLLYPVGARTVALGQALTARGEVDGMFINPATLIDLAKSQIVVHRASIGEDPMTTVSLLIHSRVAGVFGLTYRLIDYGSTDATDDQGNIIGKTNTVDQVLIASFATSFGKGVSAGLNYRLFNMSTNCEGFCGDEIGSGTTHMLDGGVRYAPRFLSRLLFGASLMYAGQKLQVNNALQADPTPARLRLGAAYDASKLITKDSTIAVWLHLDAVQRLHDTGAPGVNAGVEVILDEAIFFRAGHAAAAEGVSFGGNAVGLGLKYQRFNINVAKSVSASTLFPEPFYISFAVSF